MASGVATGQDRPATYREVFASREFRAVFAAGLLSAIGDMLAKVAVAWLVWERTNSTLMSAAAFAIGYLPWVAGGPVLATLADRMPWRRTMVGSDLARMVLVGTLAMPGIPLGALLALLFISALLAPPFEAARSALMPEILDGDRYVVGASLSNMAGQASQLAGFVIGGPLVLLLSARGALLVDAATFLGSALLLAAYLRDRPAPLARERRTSLLAETGAGLRLVFGHPVLRIYVIMVWLASALAYAPEGLAAPLADALGGDPVAVGLLLGASPLGTVLGGLVITRFISPSRRLQLLRPLALLAVAALVPVGLNLPLWAVLVLFVMSGFGMSFLLPLNALFVRALPVSFRARAFGVVQAGLQVSQGLSVVLAGWVAEGHDVPSVVGAVGLVGVVLVGAVATVWPSREKATQPVPEPA